MKMKNIAIILLLALTHQLQANENSIILFGPSYHTKRTNKAGGAYNELNWGVGYEHTNFKNESEFYTTYSVAILNDSNYNPFPFTSVGLAYRFQNNISLGVNGLVGYKKSPGVKTDENGNKYLSGGKYNFVVGAVPVLKYHFKDYSLNLIYSPEVKFKGKHYPAVFNASVSFKF